MIDECPEKEGGGGRAFEDPSPPVPQFPQSPVPVRLGIVQIQVLMKKKVASGTARHGTAAAIHM